MTPHPYRSLGSAPSASPPLEPGREEAEGLLDRELEGSEYEREVGGPLRELFDRVVAWLNDNVGSIGAVDIPWGPVLLLVLALVAIVITVLVVRPRLQHIPQAGDEVLGPDQGMTAQALRSRAQEHLLAGRLDEAYRDRFRSLVRTAEERGILSSQLGRTATEAAVAVGRSFPGHREQTRRSADLFNLSRYGGQSVGEAAYRDLAALDDALAVAPADPAPAHGAPEAQAVAPR